MGTSTPSYVPAQYKSTVMWKREPYERTAGTFAKIKATSPNKHLTVSAQQKKMNQREPRLDIHTYIHTA